MSLSFKNFLYDEKFEFKHKLIKMTHFSTNLSLRILVNTGPDLLKNFM